MKIKKIIMGVLITTSALMLSALLNFNNEGLGFGAQEVYAYTEYTSGLWGYEKYDDGTVGITAYSGFEENLTIPTKLDGLPVKLIADNAFSGNKNIKNITLQNNIISIGYMSFYNSSIENISFTDSVIYVGKYAFQNCKNLKTVKWSKNIESILTSTFDDCVNLSSINLSGNEKNIESYAFCNCYSLKEINLGDKLENIGYYAFNNSGLLSINIPDITNVDRYAFENCENLKTVCYNAPIVNDGVFKGCTSLQVVTLGENVHSIYTEAFYGCRMLSKVYTNNNLLYVGIRSFGWTTNLKSINLGSKLRSIDVEAFGHSGLTNIKIPNTVKELYRYAFNDCENLTSVTIGRVPVDEYTYFFERSDKVVINCIQGTDIFWNAKNKGLSYNLYDEIPATSIRTQRTSYTLLEGDSIQIYPIISPENTTDLIEWVSGNTSIATVDQYGKIMTCSTGTVAIKATTTSGKTCSFTVNVVSSGTTTYDTEPTKNIALAKMEGLGNKVYTGSVITPNVSVLFNPCTELIPNVDYTISFTNNKNIGIATVKVTGIGKYKGTITGTFNIVLPPVTSLAQKKPYTSNTIEMTWKTIGDATGYEVYRATTSAGKYDKVATTTSATYRETKIGVGSTYYYKVRAYKTVNGKKIYGDFSKITGMATKPKKVVSLKQKKVYSDNSIQLSWSSVSKATGYEVYRATSKNGKYKKVLATTKTNIKNNNLKAGNTYYYKVRPYISVSGNKIYGDFSSAKSMITKCKAPSIKTKIVRRQAKISWKKVAGANGYEIYMSTDYSGYKKIKTLGVKKTSYTKKKLSRYKDYYIKVKAYRKVGGKKIYSSWSNICWVNVYY